MSIKIIAKAKVFLIVVGCLLFSACTTSQYIKSPVIAPKNSAELYITRPDSLWGAAFAAPIYVNNQHIGRIGNGGKLTWVLKPGSTTVSTMKGFAAVDFQKGDSTISFNAVKGKTYFIQVLMPYQVNLVEPKVYLKLTGENNH